MKLNIKPISQRDPKWGKLKMPDGGEIEDYGCLTVCIAMQFGLSVKDIVNKDIYSGNYISWSKLTNVFPYIFEWVKNKTQMTYKDVIRQRIDKGLPTIFEVDFDPGIDGVQQHFCLAIGYDNDDILFNDPWTGETYYLSAIYYHIMSLRLLTPVNYQSPQPPDNEDALNKCLTQLEQRDEKITNLSNEVKGLETSRKKLEEKHQKLKAKHREQSETTLDWQNMVGIDSDEIVKFSKIEEKLKELKDYRNRYYKNLPYDARYYGKIELLVAAILKIFDNPVPKREAKASKDSDNAERV